MGDMCICIPNMKFLCLAMCQGEVCTDNANDDDTRQTNHDYTYALWLINQMSQKTIQSVYHFCDVARIYADQCYDSLINKMIQAQ